MFTKLEDLLSLKKKYARILLFHLKNSIILRYVHAYINSKMQTTLLNHSEQTDGTHAKNVLSFMKSIDV